MAGYLGTKAVLLSTTAADVVGNAEIGGDLTVGGAFTSQGIDDNASATAMTLDASGNVGIGTSSPATSLHLGGSSDQSFEIDGSLTPTFVGTSGNIGQISVNRRPHDGAFADPTKAAAYLNLSSEVGGSTVTFSTTTTNNVNPTERMRIDASGNLLVGTTNANAAASNVLGHSIKAGGLAEHSNDDVAVRMNRKGSDGSIAEFRKDGSTVGSISADAGYLTIANGSGYGINIRSDAGVPRIVPRLNNGAADNAIDLGDGGSRYDDIYATNGTIQTSDRNEKQDIEALSDAEQRVAVACKGLLRKFRWKDAVAEKGDDARIHFGIIAQDLQDAFAAEGLDAGRYAMFISSTWWETQTDVPAVEAVAAVYEDVVIPAVLDEEGNEVEPERTEQQLVTEAVEAKDAYTRTDTYETLEEAPEGAAERTRLGVRYPELLAFIIGAM